MTQTIYSKILKNRTEPILYEDESWFVILANQPINEGHLLVIPKSPSQKFYDTPHIEKGFAVATQFAKILQKTYEPPRVSLFVKGFTVEQHAHIHILPLYSRDDMNVEKKNLKTSSIMEMEKVANKISPQIKKGEVIK